MFTEKAAVILLESRGIRCRGVKPVIIWVAAGHPLMRFSQKMMGLIVKPGRVLSKLAADGLTTGTMWS